MSNTDQQYGDERWHLCLGCGMILEGHRFVKGHTKCRSCEADGRSDQYRPASDGEGYVQVDR